MLALNRGTFTILIWIQSFNYYLLQPNEEAKHGVKDDGIESTHDIRRIVMQLPVERGGGDEAPSVNTLVSAMSAPWLKTTTMAAAGPPR